MDGVILFADDDIFKSGFENNLFNEFLNDGTYTVLPINNISALENSISSISTFKALIIDWNFKRESIFMEDIVEINDENPYEFLKKAKLFSIVFVYSREIISPLIQDELQSLYPNRIYFATKESLGESADEFKRLKEGISKFEYSNSHLEVPYVWSQTINKSSQEIFSELEAADKFWIKELYYSSARKVDKVTGIAKFFELEPTVQVINLFQNILSERLIQSMMLKDSIKNYSQSNFKEKAEVDDILKLYSKLYYTPTPETDTVMTGDIYKLDSDCFGIIISPECDIMKLININESIECLCFSSDSFNKIKDFIKPKKNDDEGNAELIRRTYNQDNPAIHLLPIYKFSDEITTTALIDFRFNLKLIKGKYFDENKKNRSIKLNTPYIQQLRQRYLSYVGRVGVPAIPDNLRFPPK